MVKRCSFGVCDSDSRYPERLEGGVQFVPFPKPKTNYEKCLRWIKLCGRPHEQLNPSKINSNRYVCTKHFCNGSWPTKEHPDPLPADPDTPTCIHRAHRLPSAKRIRLLLEASNSKTDGLNTSADSDQENPTKSDCLHHKHTVSTADASSQTSSLWVDPMDAMCLAAENNELRKDGDEAFQNLAKATLIAIEAEHQDLSRQENTKPPTFNIEGIIDNEKLIKYYTGFSKQTFLRIYNFLVPDENSPILEFVGIVKLKEVTGTSLMNQQLLTLCKLRNDFDLIDLAYRFAISEHKAGVIFNTWVSYMYLRFSELSTWPDREDIKKRMPVHYFGDFPNTLAILDCTEIKTKASVFSTEEPQSNSNGKSSNKLKAVVAVDPRGSVLYTSSLLSSSVSDKELFEKCGLKQKLIQLVERGFIKPGDGLLADKDFHIEDSVQEIGLQLNISPFGTSGAKKTKKDVFLTREVTKHRVHVECAIRRIKSFKILSNKFQVEHMSTINEIWNVCAFLSNFMPLCIQEP